MEVRSLILLFVVPISGSAFAEPPFKPLRFEESYEYLQDPSKRTDFLDALKYIPVTDNPKNYLTLGGEVRERFEYFDNPLWGDKKDDGYLLQRYMIHGDLHAGESFRFFSQLKSGLISWNDNPSRSSDKDELDVHQLFAEVKSPSAYSLPFLMRLGRQELMFGSQRLVSVREAPNVRQSFDGVRATLLGKSDLFLVRPATTDPYVFDDDPDKMSAFWGSYTVLPLSLLKSGNIDLYYLGIEDDGAEFDQGTAHETRHSIGTRLSGNGSGLDYNFEGVYQFGGFGGGHVNAWTFASDTGYSFSEAPLKPRIGLKADLASGDNSPDDNTLNTFNPLFPKGAYFNQASIIGPLNIIDLHPSVDISPHEDIKLTFDWDFLWRASEDDGVYGVSGNLLRSGKDVDARYIGSQISTEASWQIDRHLSINAAYTHFLAGDFIEKSGDSKDIDYFSTWGTFKF